MEIKRYSLLGNYGYICPMIFTEDLTGEIYIEPTDSYEDFVNEIKEKLGIEDVSARLFICHIAIFIMVIDGMGLCVGHLKPQKKLLKLCKRLKNMGKVGLAKTCPNV